LRGGFEAKWLKFKEPIHSGFLSLSTHRYSEWRAQP